MAPARYGVVGVPAPVVADCWISRDETLDLVEAETPRKSRPHLNQTPRSLTLGVHATGSISPESRGQAAATTGSAGESAAAQLPRLEVVADPYQAVAGAGLLALLTEWDEFRWLDFSRVAEAMVAPRALVDARNLLDPAAMRRRGFAYQGVGR